jgi:RNA polymerase sigma factor (sigma-70 family)
MVTRGPYPFTLKTLTMTDLQLESAFLLYRKTIFNYCFSCLHNIHDAEDMTMTLFLNLCKKSQDVDFATVENYLVTSAKNLAIDLQRSRKFYQKVKDDVIPNEEVQPEVFSVIESKHINELISKLSPKMQEVLTLRHICGYSRIQIAEIMGASQNTVRNNLVAAVSKLKNLAKQP